MWVCTGLIHKGWMRGRYNKAVCNPFLLLHIAPQLAVYACGHGGICYFSIFSHCHLTSSGCPAAGLPRPPAVMPPGHYTTDTATLICPAGSFRADWKQADQAGSCTACGTGVMAVQSDRVVAYDPVTYVPTEIAITTSSDDCCKCVLGGTKLEREVWCCQPGKHTQHEMCCPRSVCSI